MAGYELNTAATVVVFAFDVVTGLGVTGQTGTNLKLFIKEKGGTVVEITDTTPTELSSTNAPGYYEFDLAAAEINTQYTHLFPRSTTTSPNNVGAVVVPPNFTVPVNFYQGTNQVVLLTPTQPSIDAIETDTNSLNDTKITTTRANNLDNLDAAVSSRSTVSASTALPASPTPDTVGDAWKRASVGIPLSAAGASGGLSTYDDVNAGVIFGTVDDTTPAVGNFTGNSALEGTIDDYYTGRFLIFTSNSLGPRKISSYTATTRTFEFLGSAGDADRPFDAAPANGSSFIIFGLHGA